MDNTYEEYSDEEIASYIRDAEDLTVKGYYSTIGAAQSKNEPEDAIADLQAAVGYNQDEKRERIIVVFRGSSGE